MAHLQYFSYPGFGERVRKDTWYSQAVRVGDTIVVSGQGGWDCESGVVHADVDAEVDQAFENVDRALRHAGGQGWSQVYKVSLFMVHISDEFMGALVRNLKAWCPDHQPILTGVGVAALAIPGMRVEIEVTAHDVASK